MTVKFNQKRYDESVAELARLDGEIGTITDELKKDYEADGEWTDSRSNAYSAKMANVMDMKTDRKHLQEEIDRLELAKIDPKKMGTAAQYIAGAFQEFAKNNGDMSKLPTEEQKVFGGSEKPHTFRIDYNQIPHAEFMQVLATDTTAGTRYLTEVAHSPVESMKAFGGTLGLVATMNSPTGNVEKIPTVDDSQYQGQNPAAQGTTVTTQDLADPTEVLSECKTISSQAINIQNESLFNLSFNVIDFVGVRAYRRIGRVIGHEIAQGTGSGTSFQGIGVAAKQNYKRPAAQNGVLSIDDMLNTRKQVNDGYLRGEGGMFGFNTGSYTGGRAGWSVASETRWKLIGLKDTEGRPLLNFSWSEDGLPNLLGYPVVVDHSLSDAVAEDTVGAVFGQFDYYLFRMVNQIDFHMIQDSATLAKNQSQFIVFAYADGRAYGAVDTNMKTSALATFRWKA